MIQTKRINGIDISYTILDPAVDDIRAAYKPGATVKELGQGYDMACNFNFADTNAGIPIGRLIVDGKSVIPDIPKTVARDELYMMPDKSLHIGKAPAGALWAVEGSPRLLRGGKDVVQESIWRDQLGEDIWTRNTIRMATGVTANGYLVIARTLQAIGLSMMAAIMQQFGCVDALNGDGGGSSYLWPEDTRWGRKLGSAIVSKKREVQKVTKPILIIDPGHGGKDPGGGTNQYWKEKDLTLQISLYQQKRFAELGVYVVMTRTTDIYLDSDVRTGLVKDSGAKYCISNHINSGGGDGAEAIHSIYSDGKLAQSIADNMQAEGQNVRRVFDLTYPGNNKKDYYFMHRDTGSVETVIVEYGFADSKQDDVQQLRVDWQKYAEAVVKAFCEFVGQAYTPPATPKPKKTKFSDVEAGRWSEGAIKIVSDAGIMVGDPGGTFRPRDTVTREELASVIAKLLQQK